MHTRNINSFATPVIYIYNTIMRIAFDAKRLYNNFTGLGNYSRTMIDILSENFPNNEYLLYTPKIKVNDITEAYLTKEHCRTVLPHGMFKGGIWRTFAQAADLRTDGVELFHGLSHEIPIGLKGKNIPSVVTIHDVAFKTFTGMYHWHDRRIYDLKFRYSCNNADHIIAISECTKKDIIRFYGIAEEKVSVIYQPVQSLFYSPLDSNSAREIADSAISNLPKDFMLYVGSINSRKNLLSVVKAIETMPEQERIPLVIVGNGREYKTEVKKYISSHQLDKYFIWASNIRDNKQLQALYTSARLFVYPSFYEGFGLPVVEAMLCGCPVLTSNVSSLPEAGGPLSLQVNPNDIEDIANAMTKGLADEELRDKMIDGGREYALDNFSPEGQAKKLMSVYWNVIEQH